MKTLLIFIVLFYSSLLVAKLQAPMQIQQLSVTASDNDEVVVSWQLISPIDVDRLEVAITVADNAVLLSEPIITPSIDSNLIFYTTLSSLDGLPIAVTFSVEYQVSGEMINQHLYQVVVFSDNNENSSQPQVPADYDAQESYR